MSDEYVYFARYWDDDRWIKIGFTCNVHRRMRALDTEPLLVIGTGLPRMLERHLHRHFAHLNVIGEWFYATPELSEIVWDGQAGIWPYPGYVVDLCEVW